MVSPSDSYTFEPSLDGLVPSVIPMTMDQVRYANNFNTFRGGFLFFTDENAKDIYSELGINNWTDILSNREIQNILLEPSYEGLKRIIDIKDSAVFERVRAVFHRLKSDRTNDISLRVQQIINTRYKELQRKKVNTEIVIEKKDVATPTSDKEVESLKAENKIMQEQLATMQRMMEKLISEQPAPVPETDVNNNEQQEVVATRKVTGRPKKISE